MAFVPTSISFATKSPSLSRSSFVTPRQMKQQASVAKFRMDMAPLNADEKLAFQETRTLEGDQSATICRCWKSSTFPMCSGAHKSFNSETGSHVGPIIISAPASKLQGEPKSAANSKVGLPPREPSAN